MTREIRTSNVSETAKMPSASASIRFFSSPVANCALVRVRGTKALMNERAARDVTLVRAIETADVDRAIWSDAERTAASRAAAESVGASASDDAFIAERARFTLARIGKRHPNVQSLSRAPAFRAWVTPIVFATAFALGALGADVGPAHQINLLAPPILALIAWNLAVYIVLVATLLVRPRRGSLGPLRQRIVGWMRDNVGPLRRSTLPQPLVSAVARFGTDWPALALPLWRMRAASLLHASAAFLAFGAIVGLYVRGIALEYRAAWQSTFLDAQTVAAILHVVLAPGAWLTGIAIPDASHLATIGAASAGENAAPWIHLYAGTILLLVIAPRAVLAAWSFLRELAFVRRFPVPLGEPYFRRLVSAWRGGDARVVAVSYSYAVQTARRESLVRIMTRAFESPVAITWLPDVAYGSDEVPELPQMSLAGVLVVFSLNATPERDNHGAFAAALASRSVGATPLVAVVDTSDFVERFAPERIREREAAWEQALALAGIDVIFVRLASPDVQPAADALAARLADVAA